MCCITLLKFVITVFIVETISRLRSIGRIAYRICGCFSFVAMHYALWVVDNGESSHFSVVMEDFIPLSPSVTGIVSRISVRLRGNGTSK